MNTLDAALPEGDNMEQPRSDKEWGVWAFRTVLMIMVTAGAAFGNQVWHEQQRIAERLNAMDIERATFSASRFTASDWVTAKSVLDTQINAYERRIFKLESAAEQISKSLDRIESRLGTQK
jgi:hypothetical protein